MRRIRRLMCLAAAISIAAAVVPDALAAGPGQCQSGADPNPSPSSAGGVNIHKGATIVWCSSTVILSNSDIADGTNYPDQATAQSPNYNPISNAISINALLTAAGIPPQTVTDVGVERQDGTGRWVILDASDISSSPPFIGGLKPAIWLTGTETNFIRPLRSSSDPNANDNIASSGGTPIDLFVSAGPLLTVNVHASATTATAGGKPVTFTASVPGQPAGALTFTWNFEDQKSATGATVTHRFAAAGVYNVVATAQAQGSDAAGISNPVAITVGNPPVAKVPGNSRGSNKNKHAHNGGKSSGKTTTTPSSTTTNTNSGNGAGSSGTTTTTTTTTAATTTATTTTSTASTQTPPAPKHVPPVKTIGGTIVKGRLIADVVPISAVQLAQENGGQAAQTRVAAAAVGGGSITPLGGIAAGCAIILLLGSGAGSELRSRRRPVRPA